MVPHRWKRRLVLGFESLEHPDDARRRVHVFQVYELAWEDELGAIDREVVVDGRSRRPIGRLVWGRWRQPVQMDRSRWYRTDTMWGVPA